DVGRHDLEVDAVRREGHDPGPLEAAVVHPSATEEDTTIRHQEEVCVEGQSVEVRTLGRVVLDPLLRPGVEDLEERIEVPVELVLATHREDVSVWKDQKLRVPPSVR